MSETQPEVADSSPPLVFISYSHKDLKFEQRLRLFLSPAERGGQISLWDDRDIEVGEEWNAEIRAAIERARVAVLVLSPDYLASKWVTDVEFPHLLGLESARGLRIAPILARSCDWKSVAALSRIQIFPPDAKPISGRSAAARDKLFTQAAALIVEAATRTSARRPGPEAVHPTAASHAAEQQPSVQSTERPIEALVDYQLSDEASAILRRARILATFDGMKRAQLTTPCLLFAIAEGGRGESDFFRTPHFLWREIGEKRRGYQEALRRTFPLARYSSSTGAIDFEAAPRMADEVSPNVLRTFRLASGISTETVRQTSRPATKTARPSADAPVHRAGVVHARHLLAALLFPAPADGPTGASLQLAELEVDPDRLREKFLAFVIKSLPDDDHDAWRAILSEGPAQANTPGVDAKTAPDEATKVDETGFRAPLPGFLTDYWRGEDLLDITADVNAIASLIAAWSVEPPLSIGLFGDWGSGKTHFMRQLKARVETLSRRSRQSKLPQNAIGYYKNIVQIEFNAWHYIEGNLWASLVEHIFAHLRFSDQEEHTLTDARRQTLMEKIGVTQQVQAKVEERKAQLKSKENAARDRASDAKNSRDDTSEELQSLRDEVASTLNHLHIPIEFSAEQQGLLQQVGLSSAALTSAVEIRKQYQEAKSLWRRLRAQLRVFITDPMDRRRWAVAAALVLIPILAGFGLPWVYQALNGDQLSSVYTYIGSAMTFVLTFVVAARPYWEQVTKTVALLREKADAIEQGRQKRILELETELSVATQQYKEAEREAETFSRQVQELETELAGTTASKILAEFIEDRAAASDYRRHLGVLALIRRDFEKLAALFGEQREDERRGNGAHDDRTINRIVLYIDDLDRCPPERVVQVLQAIHLLLAFPLFVVVVGVDARWVIRSLEESYEWLRDDVVDEDDEQRDKRREPRDKTATPHDYLEKIFQIPFWLKPMEDAACKKLLEGLTRDSRGAIPDYRATELIREARDERETRDAPTEATRAPLTAADGPQSEQTSEAIPDGIPQVGAPAEPPASAEPSENVPAGATNADTGNEEAAADRPTAETVAGTRNAGERIEKVDPPPADEEEAIDLAPQSLQLTHPEIEYMKEVTPIVGRSPRAVKRFLNCYRLIRVGLRPAQMDQFIGTGPSGGDFKAVMILLAVITGAPEISVAFLEELDICGKAGAGGTLQTFLDQLDKIDEINAHPDWQRVKAFFDSSLKSDDTRATFAALLQVAPAVSRYSFRVARPDATAKNKRETARRTSSPRQRVKDTWVDRGKASAV